MAYGTREQLAQALGNLPITVANGPILDACLEASAAEIDHVLPDLVDPVPELVVRTNINRAVEWYKAPDTYNGGVGFAETGTLEAPASGFGRHSAALTALKHQWGIG